MQCKVFIAMERLYMVQRHDNCQQQHQCCPGGRGGGVYVMLQLSVLLHAMH